MLLNLVEGLYSKIMLLVLLKCIKWTKQTYINNNLVTIHNLRFV